MTHTVATTILMLSFAATAAAQTAVADPVAARSAAAAQTQPSGDEPAPWYERLRVSGDFRSRYEGFYQEDRATRNRVRLRLRLRLDAEINDDTRFHMQVASGDTGTPVSTNQTFDEFFRPKPFNLDRAYVAYNPADASALTLGMGRFNAPQPSTQLVFDVDLNFEGGWEEVAWSPGEGIEVQLVGLQTAVNEISGAADAYMLAGSAAVTVELGAHELTISAADYGWGNPDQIALGSLDGPLEAILTNALSTDGGGAVTGYASSFNVVDVIAEATFSTGRADYPVRALGQFSRNTRAANDRDSGFWFELEYGNPRRAGTWGASYTYGALEQDLSPSAFVFSDIPGTNTRLHMLETSFVPKGGLSLDATLHLTRPLSAAVATVPDTWLTRLHLAAVVRF
jgi:hypothetical protein